MPVKSGQPPTATPLLLLFAVAAPRADELAERGYENFRTYATSAHEGSGESSITS